MPSAPVICCEISFHLIPEKRSCELLVQIRLLQHGVQAAPPIKDTGNDLIAVKRKVFKAIQVKTTEGHRTPKYDATNRMYHFLAIVRLAREPEQVSLDSSIIYLVPWAKVEDLPSAVDSLEVRDVLTENLVRKFFG